jgi:hypothetical protein
LPAGASLAVGDKACALAVDRIAGIDLSLLIDTIAKTIAAERKLKQSP